MAVTAESAWKDAFAAMPVVADTSWKANLALAIADQVEDLKLAGVFASPGAGAGAFTWNAAAFQGALSGNSAAVIADAWEAAMGASVIVVDPGAFVGADTPATKFSVVATAIFSPASIALGKAKVLEIDGSPAVADPQDSVVPGIIRDAFLLLKVTIAGTNSVVPTPAPLNVIEGAVQ